ncbi:DUF1311 domain-containing protein [Dyella psychrodurans]|uniref:DUF1311 domain-containing protein n=2 Tax=Dyella psychrodurans TaxID=1927960 RepID=A0A370WXF6_9GAMM|nr:DUF1311 domain-containing protein [Dyella psychrodurans]
MTLLFALILMGSAHDALAASFDCNKAASGTEKLICSDAETSALDDKLQQAYKTALLATDAYGKKELAKEQRNWIKYTRGICLDVACLRQVYTDRIAMLARNEKNIEDGESHCIKPGAYLHGIHYCDVGAQVSRDPNDQIDSFNQSLEQQKQSGRIIGCHRLIVLSDGMHIGPGPGAQIFGGYCVLQNGTQRQNVAICNDDMIGDFQVQPVTQQDTSDKRLIDFTYSQCYGG